ncbi:TRAP transporter small permease [Gemmobacter sp.]|uniref:TRAP transporter small permease n=1 Tax=Gemmobacter sp. TaxID=1898957 RepID=UPI002AFE274B|nr:TRAP transporter small permease subunit [Gemmobacter sp.]
MQTCLRFFGATVPALLVGALVLIVLADVLARNFFAMSILWAHEFAIVMLAAAVWLGISGAAAEGQLFGISFLTDRLPPRAARQVQMLADALVILIAGAVIHAAWAQITTARFTKFLTLGWPKWVVAALLAFGMALVILGRIAAILDALRDKRA